MLLEQARLPAEQTARADKLAYILAENLRKQKAAGGRAGLVQGLLQEFSLSSQEGVALMCLAEALSAHPRQGHARRPDPRQDQQRQLAAAPGPEPVHVRQRRLLGLADHRQAGRDA